jgi:hypothetical protein
MTYPNSSGYTKGSATSKAAAEILDESGSADTQGRFILEILRERGLRGATGDELCDAMQKNGFPQMHNGNSGTRVSGLMRRGLVIKTAVTRRTRSNRMANVYMLSCYSDKVEIENSITLSDLRPSLKTMYQNLEEGRTLRVEPGGQFHVLLQKYFGSDE